MLQVQVKSGNPEKQKTEALVVLLSEGEKEITLGGAAGKSAREFLSLGDFKGKSNEASVLYPPAKSPCARLVLIGLGKKEDITLENFRQAAGKSVNVLSRAKAKEAVLWASPGKKFHISDICKVLTEGAVLGSYRLDRYKQQNEKSQFKRLTLLLENARELLPAKKAVQKAAAVSQAVNGVRDLCNEPGNVITPTRFANQAATLAGKFKLKCTVLSRPQIERLKMGSFLAVTQGSDQPPKFIILEYTPKKKPAATVVLVGKGVTFDSGGISIKPSDKMHEMKYDMCGGAAVLGTLEAVAALGLPVHVVGLVPATENLPSGKAIKPGDVVRSMSGKTIEIINTDAEGRLILADALTYAKRYKPDYVIDMATLTGAVLVALGKEASGLIGTNQELMDKIKKASEETHERVWQLPFYPEYEESIKSDIADIKNLANPGTGAGTITAAVFLKQFADSYAWAHIDIAATAWIDREKPYCPKGATGVGVRLMVKFLENLCAEKSR